MASHQNISSLHINGEVNECNLVEVLFHLCMHVRSYPAAIVYLSKHMQYTMLGGE